jgi:hypothetical protein
VPTLRLVGAIAAHRDPPHLENAQDHYSQALTLPNELGMRPLVAHCHLGLGTLYRRTGKREEARAREAELADEQDRRPGGAIDLGLSACQSGTRGRTSRGAVPRRRSSGGTGGEDRPPGP